ncbi:metallophosphoesterase [Telmatobacter sp. DSM 110680]|uniref:Metallophosphoesterase n=1 Tax=Telmatobacter sp. DSM 110680 TaxID=3036704 RepID=A0AAU7DP41_9BACT
MRFLNEKVHTPMRYTQLLFLPLLLAFYPGLPGDETPPAQPEAKPDIRLPLKDGSVRWAVIGDNGTGERPELEVANQMQRYWSVVKFDFVTMDGDNIYGGHSPRDFQVKFEEPYKILLDENVKFYASLGNHDDPQLEINYKPYSMGGNRYYTFQKKNVQFFVLDSNYMTPQQLSWLEDKLKSSNAKWKIAYFHHPLFTCAKFHGPDIDLRNQLMPLFTKYGVNAVWSGHEHVYEHLKPQQGIYFFLEGESGELRYHNIRSSCDLDLVKLDTDRSFMLVEVDGDQMYFQTIARSGQTIDSGQLTLQTANQK